jgi:hypothetical protein
MLLSGARADRPDRTAGDDAVRSPLAALRRIWDFNAAELPLVERVPNGGSSASMTRCASDTV